MNFGKQVIQLDEDDIEDNEDDNLDIDSRSDNED